MSSAIGSVRLFSPFAKELLGAPLLIAIAAVLFAVVAANASDPGALPALLLIALLLPLALWRWPVGAIASIFVGAAVPRISLKLFGLNLKVEHIAVLIVSGVFVSCFWKRPRPLALPDRFLIGLLVVTYFSSILFSPEPSTTLKNAIIFTLALSPYWILRVLVSDANILRRAMSLFLAVGAIAGVYGVLCFISHVLFGTMLGVTYYSDGLPAIHGSQWEPNIFGSFMSCFAAMFLFLAAQTKLARGWYVAGFLTTFVGAMVSLARAAWIGLVLAAIVGFFLRAGSKDLIRRMLVPASIALCVVVLGIPLALRIEPVRERISTLSTDAVLEDPTLVHRLIFIGHALDDISQHPFFGMGSNSFGVLWDWETDEGVEPAWVGNLFIRIWHDSGIVGLILFVLFLGSLVSRSWRLVWEPRQ